MTSRFQKLALVAHITFSVGWFGAVVPYLALAIAALTSNDEQMVRAACLSMKFIGWFVIVPFSIAALVSGLVQALGTRWGLLRHWWVLAKLALTIFAIAILFQHMQEVNRMASLAKATTPSVADLRPELIHSAGGLLVLLAAMTLSVFKPWGMTAYGRQRLSQTDSQSRATKEVAPVRELALATGSLRWKRIVGIHVAHAAIIALLFMVILHVTGIHGMHPH